jgi:hypothetical protein
MTGTGSPIFIARFADGEVTRMTTYHDGERETLDLKRGVRLARWAYLSRKKQEPPMIEAASFERYGDGKVLATYSAKDFD